MVRMQYKYKPANKEAPNLSEPFFLIVTLNDLDNSYYIGLSVALAAEYFFLKSIYVSVLQKKK